MFETIDSSAGLLDLNRLTANYLIDQTYMGRDVSKEFYQIMFVGDIGTLPSRIDCAIAMNCMFTKASHFYHRFKFLIDYLEAGKGMEPIQGFMKAIRSIPQWQIPANEEVCRRNECLILTDYLIFLPSSCPLGRPYGMFSAFLLILRSTFKLTTSKDKSTSFFLYSPRKPGRRLRSQ